MTKTSTAAAVTMIPWKSIVVPSRGENVRSDVSQVEELAASLKDKGQLMPIVVTNGGTKDRPYTLVCGFRRMDAFELNGWQNKEILAIVKEDIASDPVARMSVNWIENMQRADVGPLDQAERLHQLVTGTYPVAEGEEAKPVDKKEICRLFEMSQSHLNRMIKLFENLDPDVARRARKAEAPLRLLLALSNISGEGETKDEREEDRAKRQEKALGQWIAMQEALKAEGRQRSERSDKGQPKGKGGESEEGEKEDDDEKKRAAPLPLTKRVDPRRRTTQLYLKALEKKHETVADDKTLTATERREMAARIEGAIETLRFLTGGRKTLPYLKASDFEALEAETEETEESEEE